MGILSESIASASFIPSHPFDKLKKIDNAQLLDLLNVSPDDKLSSFLFWQGMISSALLKGEGYAIKRKINGRLIALEFVEPDRVLKRTQNGEIIYTITDSTHGAAHSYTRDDLFVLMLSSLDGKNGISAISYNLTGINSALYADEASINTFKNGMMPTTFLQYDKFFTKEQREIYKEETSANLNGAINAGKMPILEGGMKIGAIGINPADAQLLESRKFSAEEIARIFRVPAWMINIHIGGSTKWGTGMEQELIAFNHFSLKPIKKAIEQAISLQLQTPAERRTVKYTYNQDDFILADSTTRFKNYDIAVKGGIYTPNEARALEGLAPIEGGDKLVILENYKGINDEK